MTFEPTRRSLHAVAELVLAGPQYAATREIVLRVVDDGFATVHGPDVRVALDHLEAEGVRVQLHGATPADLATAVGRTARDLADVYSDGPERDVHQVLTVDADAARRLVEALAAGDAALRALAPDETPVLWPEHFDVGISVAEVNYGVSPGDGFSAEPYAYVGPWTPPANDEFWDAPFGASRVLAPGTGPETVLAFFEEGRSRLS